MPEWAEEAKHWVRNAVQADGTPGPLRKEGAWLLDHLSHKHVRLLLEFAAKFGRMRALTYVEEAVRNMKGGR